MEVRIDFDIIIGSTEDKQFVQPVLAISEKVFGQNYLGQDELTCFFDDSNKEIIIAIENEEVIGFSLVEFYDQYELLDQLKSNSMKILDKVKMHDPIAYLKLSGVHPNYQHKGVFKKMLERRDAEINGRANSAVTEVWTNEAALKKTYLKNGYSFSERVPQYWYQDSIEKGYECCQCGNPCRCEAEIYYKILT